MSFNYDQTNTEVRSTFIGPQWTADGYRIITRISLGLGTGAAIKQKGGDKNHCCLRPSYNLQA